MKSLNRNLWWKLINFLNLNIYSLIIAKILRLWKIINFTFKNISRQTKDQNTQGPVDCQDCIPLYNNYNVFVCVTMWHENRTEMEQLVDSIIRTDLENLKINGTNFYEYHVVLDDAFDHYNIEIINEYAETFIDCVQNLLCYHILPTKHIEKLLNDVKHSKVKENTPYGGRLIWYLPSKARLVLHLKNKSYIKVWKRWSQILYMDYILDYLGKNYNDKASIVKFDIIKSVMVMIDGDICFSPEALYTLVNSLISNQKLGGVFGRVNGRGNSFWANYQRFEYIQKHWLEVNADHMFGGAICLSGDFCAIKGNILADPYIQQTYRQVPESGIKVLEMDLTEDRYLSLLIRRLGYDLEKIPTALVESNIPHTFTEYFNQKRRWKPGTLANTWEIIDTVIRRKYPNNNITYVCILYQIFTIVHQLVCPSIMFLILTHALVTAFNLNFGMAIITLLIPILTNIVICLKMAINIQLYYAEFLAWIYGFIMSSYLYTICIPIFTSHAEGDTKEFIDDWLLLGGLTLIFVTAAFYNRMEAHFLFLAPIYIVLAPSTFISLPLYIYLTINHVFWGTRENNTVETEKYKNNTFTIPPKWSENAWTLQPKLEEFHNVTISSKEKIFWIKKFKENLPENYHLTLKSSLCRLRNRFGMVFFGISTVIIATVVLSQMRYDVNEKIKNNNIDPVMSTISGYFILIIGTRYLATLCYKFMGI